MRVRDPDRGLLTPGKKGGLPHRAVLRSGNNTNANGGLAYANANNASSNSNTNNGARLTFKHNTKNNRFYGKGYVIANDGSERHEPRQTSPKGRKPEHHRVQEGAKRTMNNLLEEVASMANVEASFDYVVGHLECKPQREHYRPQREAVCRRLQEDLAHATFRVRDYKEMEVDDCGKIRRVQVPKVYDRIGCHAVMVVVERYTYPTLIKNTAASIPKRGMHWLHHIVENDIRNAPELTRYYYQCDVYHYYDSIAQWRMKTLIREYIRDERLLPILDNFIELLPEGLSKGLRSSQCFANLFLSGIDKKMQEAAKSYTDETGETRSLYYRYCDDIVMFGKDKKELWKLRNKLAAEMTAIGLKIKPDEAVRPLDCGLDYLGYVHFPTHSLLRKRIKKNAARKLARIKSKKRRREIIGAFKGMACHADCKHLYYTLTGERMKKFSEMGITHVPKDGKKRFAGEVTPLSAIQNVTVEIHDFETDVRTSQGDGRYLVSFRNKHSGKWGKFFTTSEEMKDILNQVSEFDGGFPFETVIVGERYEGSKTIYHFT